MPDARCVRLSFLAVLATTAVSAAQSQTVTLTSSRDNTLYAITDGSLSNGQGPSMFSGSTMGGELRRCLVAFDLSSIPAGSTITGASLQLFVTISASPPGNVMLHRTLADRGEGGSNASGGGGGGGAGGPAANGDATWLHRFWPTVPWNTTRGDFEPVASATAFFSDWGHPIVWSAPQLAADVQSFVDQPSGNFGWTVVSTETQGDRAKRFATREHTVAAERPLLTVTFTPPAASFTTFGAGCAGSAGVPTLAPLAGSLPVLGSTLPIRIAAMPAATPLALGLAGFSATVNDNPLGLYALPFDLSVLGMNGCTQLVAADILFPLPAVSGQATWALTMPSGPTFAGFAFFVQGLVLDPAANPFGATTTNGGAAIVGS